MLVNLADPPSPRTQSYRKHFIIPHTLQHTLLPVPKSTISSLLRFENLPDPLDSLSQATEANLEDWTSHLAPDPIDHALLTELPLPPLTVVRRLAALITAPLVLPSVPHLPLWVVEYWRQAYEARDARRRWRNSKLWHVYDGRSCMV